MYYVYILECCDKTFYTGITSDLDRRVKEHNFSKLGAKYTKGRRPVRLVYSSQAKNRSDASREEAEIKRRPRAEKIDLIKTKNKKFI